MDNQSMLMNPASVRSNPCPDCGAKINEQCSRPTSTGRADVAWEHRARLDARYEATNRVSLFAPPGPNLSAVIAKQIIEEEDQATEEKLIELLRLRGWIVERPPSGDGISRAAVAKFRNAWNAADRAGRAGNSVRAGLEAARPFLNLEAVAKIDALRPAPQTYAGSLTLTAVCAVLDEIRDLIAHEMPRPEVSAWIKPPNNPNERWRCLKTGCNPKLWGEDAADEHLNATGHRVAKWPVRSAEGHRKQRERNAEVSRARKQERRWDQREADHADGEPDFLGGDFGG